MRSESKSGPMKFASASYDNFIFTKQLGILRDMLSHFFLKKKKTKRIRGKVKRG